MLIHKSSLVLSHINQYYCNHLIFFNNNKPKMITRKFFLTRLSVTISVSRNYNYRDNYPASRQSYGNNNQKESNDLYRTNRYNRNQKPLEKKYTDHYGIKLKSKGGNGYLTQSQWSERIDSNFRVNDSEYFGLKEQPANVQCGDLQYNTWDKFSEINDLDQRLSEVLIKSGHDQMTQIQKSTFDILNRQLLDLLGSAETGSGKTEAYLTPLLNSILKSYPEEMMANLKENSSTVQYPLILVLAPTRELVIQISKQAKKLLTFTQIRTVSLIGGADPAGQIGSILKGCHALVATPGRLKDFIQRGLLSLKYCNKLVIDEADRMLDMGFEPQIREIMFDFDMPPVKERHTSLFSATFPNSVMSLARTLLKPKHGKIMVGKNAGSSEACVPESINQKFILTNQGSMFRDCFKFIKEDPVKTIVFCNRKYEVETFCRFATKQSLRVSSLHGDYNHSRIESEFNLFKNNDSMILVTSIASRGLDVTDVECVINIGLPKEVEEYMHRVGRCGRIGRPGTAVTFVKETDLSLSVVKDLVNMMRRTKMEVPEFLSTSAKNIKSDNSRFDTNDHKTIIRPFGGQRGFKRNSNRKFRYED